MKMKKYCKKFIYLVVAFFTLFVGCKVAQADTLSQQTIQIIIEQEVGQLLDDAKFSATYFLSSDSSSGNHLDLKENTITLSQKSNGKLERTITFGEGGISFPSAGYYVVNFVPKTQNLVVDSAKSNLPTYQLRFNVDQNLRIQVTIYNINDDKKTDKLYYKYLVKNGNNAFQPSPNHSSSIPTNGKENSDVVGKAVNQTLKFLRLPQTGSQQATFIGWLGIFLIIGAGVRVLFAIKRRNDRK